MGFDVDNFVTKIHDEMRCELCRGVLDNPLRTTCSHIYCSGCILPWVVRTGNCPRGCQRLTPEDLRNEIELRDCILNLSVLCEFRSRGCKRLVRLREVGIHSTECEYRPVRCTNEGCKLVLSIRDLEKHVTGNCPYKEVGVCLKGCSLVLLQKTVDSHECISALRSYIAGQENKINTMETEIQRASLKAVERERELMSQITALRSENQHQALEYNRKLNEISTKLKKRGKGVNVATNTEDAVWIIVVVTLYRENGSLGFNITGGYTPEPNNNEAGKEEEMAGGVVVSKVTEDSPAEKIGLKIHDVITQVNGQDLSQASHEEAVEAFRAASEPITVEVLRRVSKNKMKNTPPNMVSISTQTEEELYGRPPTPPFFTYPPGLYQPGTRRPLAFSPSTDMGLTDIEMAHNLDYDDPYFDDRIGYEMEYEEVILHRSADSQKLGLTLCYGSLEDETTDIFISEVEPQSVAAHDGRIREGDQVLQVNGVDVRSRDQAIQLFSERGSEIKLLLARPQLQGHMEEEGGTTDTKHEKDSGVGRTDESTRNDESSEQDPFDTECTNSPAATSKFRRKEQNYSDDSVLSNEVTDVTDYGNECDSFRAHIESRYVNNGMECSPQKGSVRKDSVSSIERELALLNKEMETIHMECQEMCDKHAKDMDKHQLQREALQIKSPRIVPRMGTRLEYLKYVQLYDNPNSLDRRDTLPKPASQQARTQCEKDASTTTSAYNTGESCRSTPLTLELNQGSEEGDFKNSMLCLAPSNANVSALSDTEKQTQTPCGQNGGSSDDYQSIAPDHESATLQKQNCMGESLQDLYMQYADVMYTNQANLEHTIAIQQKLFQQQIEQNPMRNRKNNGLPLQPSVSSASSVSGQGEVKSRDSPNVSRDSPNATPPDSSGQMEWVVKRRPDGTRYITRRPMKSKLLKERAKKISEERCGMTTDDDAMSELKFGRYWSKEERKRHLEKARDHKRKRECMMRAKMETLKEAEEKKEINIVELSHRKMMKHKNKKVLDNFVTVQEMLAHGSRVSDGKTYNPLLSVTTV
ncbi:E3 ubiquitin-protein ligase PDZRN3-B-like isoform X2 [Saccostrea cucullata]|uniref:E3 ubiquitin-protein ligase PDZRN3-B-like isoform X2 n=1 Tax=Saccostrea cuccullata TaxID=36930 RepID=UPI002ED0622E